MSLRNTQNKTSPATGNSRGGPDASGGRREPTLSSIPTSVADDFQNRIEPGLGLPRQAPRADQARR